MYPIIRLAIQYRQTLLVLAVFLALGALYGLGRYHGAEKQKAAYEAAQAEFKEQARKDIVRVESEYEKILRKIRAQGGGGCVSPVISGVFDSLPDGSR